MTLDKISEKYVTDKRVLEHNYIPFYEKYFEPLRDRELKVLEIGIFRPKHSDGSEVRGDDVGVDGRTVGASLRTWSEYFYNSKIYGADLGDFTDIETDRIKTIVCNQSFRVDGYEFNKHWSGLSSIIDKFGSDYDIIIDDGGHAMNHQLISLGYLFKHLKSGGIFVIEDLHTSNFAPQVYNKTGTKNTTLNVLKNYQQTKKIDSEFITPEETEYLNKNIKSCEIDMAKNSEISFIIKK